MHTILVLGLLLRSTFGLLVISQLDLSGQIKKILEGTQGSKTKCTQHIMEVVSAVSKNELWALKMIDASSKIPSGIFPSSVLDTGNFDECINMWQNTTNGVIRGKHCTLSGPSSGTEIFKAFFRIHDRIPLWSACVPESCNDVELNGLLYKLKITLHFDVSVQFNESSCQTIDTKPDTTTGDVIAMTCFGIIFAIVAFSSVYDLILNYIDQRPAHLAFIAFSVVTNGKKLITVSNSPTQLLCLHGIRSITMMWIILGHMYTSTVRFGTTNILDAFSFIMKPGSMFILGSSVSVDTFFVIGGLVLTYTFMNTMDKANKFNLSTYYFHRWLRLTPLLAVIVLFHITLLKYFCTGPKNIAKETLTDLCRNWWWSTLFYVQNYVNPGKQCIGVSWYLAVDMQLFILSPLILLPLRNWPQKTIGAIIFLCVFVCAGVFITTWHFGFPGLFIGGNFDTERFLDKYYYCQTHTRATVWLIGIILGYYIHYYKRSKEPLKLNRVVVTIVWTLSLGVMATCVFGGHDLLEKPDDKWINSIYITFVRPSWALSLSWIIFACIFGFGGPVDWFLSLPAFQVLSKFTYSMFLVHGTLQLVVVSNSRASVYFTNFNVLLNFWGYFIFSLAIGFLCTLFFEYPMIVLEKIISSRGTTSNRDVQGNENGQG